MAQLGVLLVFTGAGFVLTAVAQLIIAFKMVPEGTSFSHLGDALMEAMKDPKNIGLSRLLQVIGTFFLLCIPAIFYSWICNGRNSFWLGFNRYLNVYQVLIGFLIIFTANIMAAPLEDLVKTVVVHFPSLNHTAGDLERMYNDQVTQISNLTSWPEFLMALLIMAFFPAMFEELFFRGALQNLLVRWWKRPVVAIIFTSLVFSLIHMSIYLFLSRAALGFVLGYMYYKTGNIWVNIIAHFLNNAIAITQMFILSRANKTADINELDPKLDWWWALVAIVILALLFKLLSRYSDKNKVKIFSREQELTVKGSTGNPFANSN